MLNLGLVWVLGLKIGGNGMSAASSAEQIEVPSIDLQKICGGEALTAFCVFKRNCTRFQLTKPKNCCVKSIEILKNLVSPSQI